MILRKYPGSYTVSLVAAFATGLLVAVIGWVRQEVAATFLINSIIIFLVSGVAIFLILELFVYPKIRMITMRTDVEIRKLKELEEYRREFLGNVSHELKTPIFAIEGFIETLLGGAMNDKKVNKKFLQKALKHSERLASLVEDILVISQIESGDLEMNLEQFRIHELIVEIVDSLEGKFTKKGRNINCVIQANGHENTPVRADKQRIDQVIYNLLDNAVKYGDSHGTVTISILDHSDKKLKIGVRDQGRGIEAVHLPRLFERFYRIDKSRSREKGGTGLGLAICKHMIEAHGEKIWVESEIGKGTELHFTLSKTEPKQGQ